MRIVFLAVAVLLLSSCADSVPVAIDNLPVVLAFSEPDPMCNGNPPDIIAGGQTWISDSGTFYREWSESPGGVPGLFTADLEVGVFTGPDGRTIEYRPLGPDGFRSLRCGFWG